MTTYENPVYPHNFPDPFVLKYCGEYWAYCTGPWPDGRIFGILHSRDLVTWQEVGGAMEPLPGSFPCYWAPEVMYENGRFYLYYSVGDEVNMHIRVATAVHPAGLFTDQGIRLTQEPFAIDAHVFIDDDGIRYLFYATDFLEHRRIGTGTVMDRMRSPFSLAGQPQPVTRARFDWQIFDPQRAEKGGVCWHTIEGSFVLKRKGIYYQMFSGGNWQNPSYGVGYALTRNLATTEEWQQMCDGEQVLPILRTLPGQVTGPGHNSVVRGPDNRQLFCVYHRWGNGSGRQMAIDPLDFAGERMLVMGPSHTPRRQPTPPTFADYFDGDRLDECWQVRGQWKVQDGAAVAFGDSGETAVLTYDVQNATFLAEVNLRAVAGLDGTYGLNLLSGETNVLRFHFGPKQDLVILIWQNGTAWTARPLTMPPGFDFTAYHLLRVEVNGRHVSVCLDDRRHFWQETLAQQPTKISLVAEQSVASFTGFALTSGWQDCFETAASPAELGWQSNNLAGWSTSEQQLQFAHPSGEGVLSKGPFLAAYELVVNARLVGRSQESRFGIAPLVTDANLGPLLLVETAGAGWRVSWQDGAMLRQFPLPAQFDPFVYQQFRLRKANGRLTVFWEQHHIGDLPVTTEPTRVALYGRTAAAFDMIRVTAVPPITDN